MTLIQVALIAAICSIAVLYVWAVRSRLLSRLAALAFLACGIVFVLYPDLTTAIARRVGVGRGTDLLVYIFLMASAYAFLVLYVKLRALERRLTELARAVALDRAEAPEQKG